MKNIEKKGMKVDKDEPIYTLYADSKLKLEEAIKLANKLRPIVIEGMILETIGPPDKIFIYD